ncbi:Hypothetical protein Minf_0019 [Methylacidiphilum infernorum V4]|uniref:Uncharacterized protein n=1 Tax=Methylacidiphilum infernorum (isolate V4) TaxID=481448 RepID=B3DWI4_METI4|nr:Hypothetical protein Minf_0019 [Methylacidiphilum infernorum V4]
MYRDRVRVILKLILGGNLKILDLGDFSSPLIIKG